VRRQRRRLHLARLRVRVRVRLRLRVRVRVAASTPSYMPSTYWSSRWSEGGSCSSASLGLPFFDSRVAVPGRCRRDEPPPCPPPRS